MEILISFKFTIPSGKEKEWSAMLKLLAAGNLGWEWQDSIEPINEKAADSIEDVWESMSGGFDIQYIEVYLAELHENKAHIELMMGYIYADELADKFGDWLLTLPVEELSIELQGDDE